MLSAIIDKVRSIGQPAPDLPATTGPTPNAAPTLDVQNDPRFVNKQQQSLYQAHPDHIIWLANQFADGSQDLNAREDLLSGGLQGLSVEEQERQRTQQRIADLSGQLTQTTANMDDGQFKQFQEQLQDEAGKQPPIPHFQTASDAPNVWQSLSGAIGSIIDPSHAFAYGAAPFEAQKARMDYANQMAAQNYAYQNQAHQEHVGAIQNLASNAERYEQAKMNAKMHQASIISSQINVLQNAMQRMDARHQLSVQHAQDLLKNAKTPQEVDQANTYLKSLEPSLAMNPDQLKQAQLEVNHTRERQAIAEWNSTYLPEWKAAGIITPERGAALEVQRQQIAKDAGINVNALAPVPTAATMQDQFKTQYLQLAKDKFGWAQDTQKERFAQSQSRIDISQAQYALAMQKYQTSQSQFDREQAVREANAAVNIHNAFTKDANAAVTDMLKGPEGVEPKIRAKEAEIAAMPDGKAKQTKQAELAGLQASQAYLYSKTQKNIPEFVPFVGGQPNPNYDPNAQGGGRPQNPQPLPTGPINQRGNTFDPTNLPTPKGQPKKGAIKLPDSVAKVTPKGG